MTATDERMERMRPVGPTRHDFAWSDLPPGPRWPQLAQSIALLAFRHRFVPAMHRRYGDVFTVRVMPNRALVMFHRPEHVREIFSGDPEHFHAGKGNSLLGPVMGEHSLLLVDAGEHKRARKLVMPAFTGRAIRGYQDLVTGLAKTEVASWAPGVGFGSLDRMNALTLEVILQVVFGVTDESRLSRLRPLVNNTVNVSPVVFLGWGFRPLQRLPAWRRALKNQRALDEVLYEVIRDRRAAPDVAERADVLSTLICVEDPDTGDRLGDDELRDQLVTLLLAGHETTATALAWSLHELGKDPDQAARARAAARSGDDAYLEAVLKESMRLHPVIPMVVRYLTESATVGGIPIPRGATVGASILLAHAREESHPDAAAFRPERFEEGEVATNTWIPFGGGVRRCIGAGFSLMEGVAVLREVLASYDVSLPEGEAERETPKVRNITSVPRYGARIVVRPRD